MSKVTQLPRFGACIQTQPPGSGGLKEALYKPVVLKMWPPDLGFGLKCPPGLHSGLAESEPQGTGPDVCVPTALLVMRWQLRVLICRGNPTAAHTQDVST